LFCDLYVWNANDPVQFDGLNPDLERLLVATLAALIVGTSMIVNAYFKEFVRGYYIALITGGGFFFTSFLDTPVPVVIAAALILFPGITILFRFLRDHPLPQDASNV
jgi:hypothetical protein